MYINQIGKSFVRFIPQLNQKYMWSNSKKQGFSNKAKTSETAWLLRFCWSG